MKRQAQRQAQRHYIDTIDARIAGIPCQIGIISHHHSHSRHPEDGWTEAEWDALDRRGRPAEWLERKLTLKDRDQIDRLIDDHFYADRLQEMAARAAERAEDMASNYRMSRIMDDYEARFGL